MDTEETKTEVFDHSHINFLEYKGDHAAISGIGILHGLASNDELLLLLTLTLGFSSFSQYIFWINYIHYWSGHWYDYFFKSDKIAL